MPRCLELADYAIRIEDHYSKLAGQPTPMDIEWAKDGEDGKLYIVQARPETVASQREAGAFETYALKGTGPVLVTGRAVGEKIASGARSGHHRCARSRLPSARARCWSPSRPAPIGSR